MTSKDYQQTVTDVLDAYTMSAAEKLRRILANIPEKARAVIIRIFVDQDGEGCLSVRVYLDGPDLHVLNQSMKSDACLFQTKMEGYQVTSPLPLMGGDEEAFSVRDVLTDCAAVWLRNVYKTAAIESYNLPVTVYSHDEYGSLTPYTLNPST